MCVGTDEPRSRPCAPPCQAPGRTTRCPSTSRSTMPNYSSSGRRTATRSKRRNRHGSSEGHARLRRAPQSEACRTASPQVESTDIRLRRGPDPKERHHRVPNWPRSSRQGSGRCGWAAGCCVLRVPAQSLWVQLAPCPSAGVRAFGCYKATDGPKSHKVVVVSNQKITKSHFQSCRRDQKRAAPRSNGEPPGRTSFHRPTAQKGARRVSG
jgi:hypothetical protein